MVPLLAINTSSLPLILLYRVQASRSLAQVGIQEKLIGWIMNGTNVSEPKSVLAQGKLLPDLEEAIPCAADTGVT